ncbi:MAG: hypothetical protein AAFZ17_19525 [Cyanobacteria bacterium J06650_10]
MIDTVSLTIDWRAASSDLPEHQQEAQTQTLFRELRSLDSIEAVDRIAEANLPPGAMGAQWLWSILTAEIPGSALRTACTEVFDRLRDQPMELTVEVDGQAQTIDAKNVHPDDYEQVIDKLVEAAQKMKATA